MSKDNRFDWLQVWGGALIIGLVTFGVFFVQGVLERWVPLVALGVILLLLVGLAAVWAYRRGNRELAIGMAVGYAVLSLVSSGQCTLLTQEQDDQALVGLVTYPALLAAALLIGGIYSLIKRVRRGKETDV